MATTNHKIGVTKSKKVVPFIKSGGATVSVKPPSTPVARPVADAAQIALAPSFPTVFGYYDVAGVLIEREIVAWSTVVAGGIVSAFGLVLDEKGRMWPAERFPGFIKVLTWSDRGSADIDTAAERLGVKLEKWTRKIAPAAPKGGSK